MPPRKRAARKATPPAPDPATQTGDAADVRDPGVGGIVTDDGGRPLTDDGGRPVVKGALT